MTTQEAIDYFGGKSRMAEALGITRAAVGQWGEAPPDVRQYQIQVITKGKLKVSQKRDTAA